MPSFAEALKQYGFVGQLANSIPELRSILQRAAAANWTNDEFSRAVQDSRWWRNNSDAIKQYQLTKVTKPGEFKAQRDALVVKIRAIGREMGVGLGEGKGSMLGYIVDQAQSHGYDEATIREMVGHHLQGVNTTFGGQAGQVQQQIRQLYFDMGVPYSNYTVGLQTRGVLDGSSTVQQVQALVAKAAKSRFPALAQQIDAGQTVRQIADPYVQTQAQILEVAPETITLQDPLVKQGLSMRDEKGQIGLMPLWQYEQKVRADPRWDKTKNAMNATYSVLHKIGTDWGFAS
jgi:hypothetical protein